MNGRSLKIAFCNRPHWDNPLGGDGIQMLKTKEALENLFDVSIDIITTPSCITNAYDIVHIFNYVTVSVTNSFFERAIALNIPIASSSIFWDYSYIYSSISRYLFLRKFTHRTALLQKIIAKFFAKMIGRPKLLTKQIQDKYRFFMDSSDVILPNSLEEACLLQQYVNKDFKNKIHIVYNGYDSKDSTEQLPKEVFLEKYGLPEDYILEVGRIETIKNQLNVVYALLDYPDIPIVFIGKFVESHYAKKIKKLAQKRGNVFFIDFVPHNEISLFYKNAALHILPSLRESPGLVSLEALANNCPIVIANQNYTPLNTYFKSQKYIIDPLDIESMKKTILCAYKEREVLTDGLSEFTWNTAALQTWEAYKSIV